MSAEQYRATISSRYGEDADRRMTGDVTTKVEISPPVPRYLGEVICGRITELFKESGAEDVLTEVPTANGFTEDGSRVSTQVTINQKYEGPLTFKDTLQTHSALLQVVERELSPSGQLIAR